MSLKEAGVVVDSPLSGEWAAVHTPAERVPSHGTNYLGQRYAYDFVQWKPKIDLPYDAGILKHLFGAQPVQAFLCWDQPVYSVFEGVVTETGDGWKDRLRVNLVAGLVMSTFFAPGASEDDLRPLAGNYVIVEGELAVAFYAHLRSGSIRVRPEQEVKTGDVLGRVGNSGNSTEPHFHFHLMDRPEIREAEGVLCRFRVFEQLQEDAWEVVRDGIPAPLKRIRWR